MVEGLAVDNGVRAASVVADAAADAGAVGGGGIRSVLEAVGGNLAGELFEDDAGLHAGPLLFGIHLQNIVEVLAEIQDDGVVDGLAGEAGAAGTGQDGNAFARAKLDNGLYVGRVPRDDDSHGFHLVDAGVGAVEQPRVGVETHLAVHAAAEFVSDFLALSAPDPALHYRRHG